MLTSTEGTRLHVAYRLMAYTGMRREEVMGLLWKNVNLDSGRIVVAWGRVQSGPTLIEGEPKTSGSFRVLEIDPKTVEVVRRWKEQQELERMMAGDSYLSTLGDECSKHDSMHVVTDELGKPYNPNWVTRSFTLATEAAGLPRRRLYDLRHTHGTLMLQSGQPVKVISERLGHSTTAFTMDTYLEVTPTMQKDSVSAFSKMMGE